MCVCVCYFVCLKRLKIKFNIKKLLINFFSLSVGIVHLSPPLPQFQQMKHQKPKLSISICLSFPLIGYNQQQLFRKNKNKAVFGVWHIKIIWKLKKFYKFWFTFFFLFISWLLFVLREREKERKRARSFVLKKVYFLFLFSLLLSSKRKETWFN